MHAWHVCVLPLQKMTPIHMTPSVLSYSGYVSYCLATAVSGFSCAFNFSNKHLASSHNRNTASCESLHGD
jgi:hypothetical protein